MARRVVLAAGTLGTNELLLRSREGVLPRPVPLPREKDSQPMATSWVRFTKAGVDLAPPRPDVTSVMRFFDEAPEFTLAAPTFNEPDGAFRQP